VLLDSEGEDLGGALGTLGIFARPSKKALSEQ